MEHITDVIAAGDADVDAIDAYCFDSSEFYVAMQAVSDEEEISGSALLRVPMDAPQKFELLDEFDRETVNYWAESPKKHFVQASGRYIRQISNGTLSEHRFDPFGKSLMHMSGTIDGTVVVFGDDGIALKLVDGKFARINTQLTENLHTMHMNAGGLTAIGGNFGSFAVGQLDNLQPLDTTLGRRIILTHVRDDGSIAISSFDDAAREIRDDELIEYDPHNEDWSCVVEFQGEEFWGDEVYGVFVRRAKEFIPVFETEYAFTMHATESHLLINSSFAVRIFDGSQWRNFEITDDPKEPVVEAELDFEPNWPV